MGQKQRIQKVTKRDSGRYRRKSYIKKLAETVEDAEIEKIVRQDELSTVVAKAHGIKAMGDYGTVFFCISRIADSNG